MSEAAEHFRAADAALQAGRRPEAEAAIRAALLAAPADPKAQHFGGMLLLRLGRAQDALGPLAAAAAGEAAPAAWIVAHGNAAAMLGRVEEAEAAFRRALAREPGNAVALLNLGILLTGRGAPEEAVRTLEAALAARPGHAPGLLALGTAHHRAGDAFAAAASWRQAVAAKPDYAEAYANLGGALAELGQAEEAEAALRRALVLNPRLVVARQRLGELCLALGRFEEAEAALREVTAQAPRAAGAFNGLGLALRARGRLPEALVAFRSAVAADPALAEAQANLASLLAFLGEGAAATAAAGRALALAPQDDRAHLAVAMAAAARGDRPAAVAASREALRLRPFTHIPATGAAQATVLVLRALGEGHVVPAPGGAKLPEGHDLVVEQLDPARFARVDLHVDALAADPGLLDRLPRCDVIYNAIAAPAGLGLDLARLATERLGLPVINAPAAVPRAAPEEAAALYEGIEGLVVPRALRLAGPAGAEAAMAAAGLRFPVLAQPAGQTAKLLRGPGDLAALPAAAGLRLTAFVPFADADGLWRRYRLSCVGGRVLPGHLTTATGWEVPEGAARARMRTHPEDQAQESDFLGNAEKRLGLARLLALGDVAERLGLDVFGVDVALLPDERLLLMAAGPGLRPLSAEAREGFPYLQPGIARLAAALGELVLRRAGR